MGMHFGGGGGGMGRLRNDEIEKRKISEIDHHMAKRLWGYIAPYKWSMALAIFCMLAASTMNLAGPYLLKTAIDSGMKAGNLSVINMIALVYIVTHLANWFFSYNQTYIMSKVGQDVIFSLRRELHSHLQKLGFKFYDRLQAGRIMSRVTNDIEALNQLVTSGLVNLVNDVFTLVGIITIMLFMNPRLALVSFATIPLLIFVTNFFTRRMREAYHDVRRKIADVNANLQESISGMKVVQSFSREDQNLQRFDQTNQGNLQANMQAATLHSAFFPLIEVIGALGTALVLWVGGTLVMDNALTVGTVAAFLGYVTRFFQPIRDVSQVLNVVQSAAVSTERIFEFLDEVPEVQDAPGAQPLPAVVGEVRYEHVSFAYEEGQRILHDITLEVKPGRTVAFVGATGAGKSSIINLLCRFYDPQEGRILIDGHDIRHVTQQSLRSQLGIVLQDTFIFSGTVKENIRYGRLDATDEEIIEAAKAVNAHQFIMRLPDGYETQVHERGSTLSVGQRQLISFARALIANPKILILDEATSSVDAYTELLIQQALDRLLQGRTAFVIAHRLSTIRNADSIYALDLGRIIESGSHEELLAKDGIYRKLYEMQFKSQEEPLAKEA